MRETINKITCLTAQLNVDNEPIGTAFFITETIVITAKHNIEVGAKLITLNLADKVYAASVLHEIDSVDIIILEVDTKLEGVEFLEVCTKKPNIGEHWISRGYPSSKDTGENMFSADNCIQQAHLIVQNEKFDIELDMNMKLASYSGFSGAPLVVQNMIVGVITAEHLERTTSKELKALSMSNIEDILVELRINIKNEFPEVFNSIDISAIESYSEINAFDYRSLTDKLQSVCSDINSYKLKKYCQDVASGVNETKRYNQQHIQAMKYRIFEVCQNILIDFIVKNGNTSLTQDEIEELITKFTEAAEGIINTRSSDYNYPIKNKDTLRKLVLDLIDTCYLSFDEKGIYDA